MAVRVRVRRMRSTLTRLSTKTYVRVITILVVLGIFISESLMKEVSEAQIIKGIARPPWSERVEIPRTLLESKKENSSQNGTQTAIRSESIQELLQEAIPEKIFGFSSEDRNISTVIRTNQQAHNSSSLPTDLTREVLPANKSAKGGKTTGLPSLRNGSPLTPTTRLVPASLSDRWNATVSSKHRNKKKMTNPFKGVLPTEESKHLFKIDNVTHLSFMLYRLISTHEIESVLDVPCKQSMFWMKELLQILEFEVPKFHYRCLTPDSKSLAEGVVRYRHLSSATVLKNAYPWASRLPRADLALCWYGLGYLPPNQSWGLLKALRVAGVKFVLVPNYPEVRHNPSLGSSSGRVNVRRAPYRFNEPLRVVNNVSAQPSIPKQLLFYDLDGIRRDAL